MKFLNSHLFLFEWRSVGEAFDMLQCPNQVNYS